MADRVLVTGISGFIGGHVALALLEAGYVVRGSLRSLSRAETVRDALARQGATVERLEFVALDLLDDSGWAEAMADTRYLQHVASPFVTTMPDDRMELVRPAVDGTTRALRAAFAAGVERVVLTSSIAAVMYGHAASRTAPFTAADWTDLEGPGVNAYTESKTRAERAAWDLAAAAGRSGDLVAVNPGMVLGPLLDDDPGTSVRLVQRLLDGSMPAAPRMALPLVDVRDVAAAHLRAMTAPEAGGQRFLLSAGTVSFIELARMLRAALPEQAKRTPRIELPDWIIRLYALFDRDMRGNLGELGLFRRVDAGPAETLIGRPFISPQASLVETARSLLARNLA